MANINYKNVIVGVIIFLLLGAVCYLMCSRYRIRCKQL